MEEILNQVKADKELTDLINQIKLKTDMSDNDIDTLILTATGVVLLDKLNEKGVDPESIKISNDPDTNDAILDSYGISDSDLMQGLLYQLKLKLDELEN